MRRLVRLVPVGDGPWRLTLDRTHWKFVRVDINFLVLGIAYRGIALPVFWSILGKAGNSNTAERVALMDRRLAVFGVPRWQNASSGLENLCPTRVLLAGQNCIG
ncbi:MAG: hypothetical protein HC889_12750 [Synechococcaceae cyanobacterium SM1_2_3]|nr:hypothetical protein [Synechococcaceae cyanobacterium SM1_2_3]